MTIELGIWNKEWTETKHTEARHAAAGVQPAEEGVHVARTKAEIMLDMACDEITRLQTQLMVYDERRAKMREHLESSLKLVAEIKALAMACTQCGTRENLVDYYGDVHCRTCADLREAHS